MCMEYGISAKSNIMVLHYYLILDTGRNICLQICVYIYINIYIYANYNKEEGEK